MLDALILCVPVEQCLELLTIVGADLLNAEREPLDDIVDEVDGVCLRVQAIDLQGPDACRVVDGCVLEPPDWFAGPGLEIDELDIDLDVMPRHLLLVAAPRLYLTHATAGRQTIQPVALQNAVAALCRDAQALVAAQVPTDAKGPEVEPLRISRMRASISGARRLGWAPLQPGRRLTNASSPLAARSVSSGRSCLARRRNSGKSLIHCRISPHGGGPPASSGRPFRLVSSAGLLVWELTVHELSDEVADVIRGALPILKSVRAP